MSILFKHLSDLCSDFIAKSDLLMAKLAVCSPGAQPLGDQPAPTHRSELLLLERSPGV